MRCQRLQFAVRVPISHIASDDFNARVLNKGRDRTKLAQRKRAQELE